MSESADSLGLVMAHLSELVMEYFRYRKRQDHEQC